MSEPTKLFSVQMPYRVFEKVKGVAKREDLSVNRLMRLAVDEFLERYEMVKPSLEN